MRAIAAAGPPGRQIHIFSFFFALNEDLLLTKSHLWYNLHRVQCNVKHKFAEKSEKMQKMMLSGKIHTARITRCEIDYEGSLAIDPELLEQAEILPYEKILVSNRNNGSRLETYAIPGVRGSREFCLNGPAARLGKAGDVVTADGRLLVKAGERITVAQQQAIVAAAEAGDLPCLEKGYIRVVLEFGECSCCNG